MPVSLQSFEERALKAEQQLEQLTGELASLKQVSHSYL
jgi:hypothetical protein